MKGQNAVEFLLTNTWSLLAVLLILGFLVLIGLPNLRNSEPERCHFAAGSVGCESIYVGKGGAGGSLAIRDMNVSNGFSRRIYVCGLACSVQASPPSAPACGKSPSAPAIEPGNSKLIVSNWLLSGSQVTCYDDSGSSTSTAVNSIYRGKLYLLYSYEHETFGSGNAHVATGELVARVGRG